MPIPALNGLDELPPGIHLATIEEVQELTVKNIPL